MKTSLKRALLFSSKRTASHDFLNEGTKTYRIKVRIAQEEYTSELAFKTYPRDVFYISLSRWDGDILLPAYMQRRFTDQTEMLTFLRDYRLTLPGKWTPEEDEHNV